MRLPPAKHIYIFLLCCLGPGWLQAQHSQLPRPPDSLILAYREAARSLDKLEAFYRQADRFPEDPAIRMMMERRIKDFSQLHLRLEKLLSNPDVRDSLELGKALTALVSLDSLMRKQYKTPALPLEEAYSLTARRHKAEGNRPKAMEALDKSLLANPAYIPSLSLRCRWQLQEGNPEEALLDAQQLAAEGHAPATDSLLALLPHFAHHLELLRREEAHTRLLPLTDGLATAYDFHPPAKAVITALQELSRQDLLRSYRNVARRALATGKRDLALRYATMAIAQSQEWELDTRSEDSALLGNIAAYAARSAEMALKEGQLRHSLEAFRQADSLYDDGLLQRAKAMDYEPLLRRTAAIILDSIATRPGPQRFYPLWHSLQENHPGLLAKKVELTASRERPSQIPEAAARTKLTEDSPEHILLRSRNLAFRIWQGDTNGYLAFRDSLKSLTGFTEPPHLTEAVGEAAITLEEAIRAWECRQEKMDDHLDAATFKRAFAGGSWTEAASVLKNMQRRREARNDCVFASLPPEQQASLVTDTEKYLSYFPRIQQLIQSTQFVSADSLLEESKHFYHHQLKGRKGPDEFETDLLQGGSEMEDYLIHRCAVDIQKGNTRKALVLMEKMRSREMDPSRVSYLQKELGSLLAEKDLSDTHLSNPKTLLARHIPMNKWYKALRKAYQKRFRQG